MSDPNSPLPLDEAGIAQRLRASDEGNDSNPSPQHDTIILQAARQAAREIGRRRTGHSLRTLLFPASLAATLLLGFGLGRSSLPWDHQVGPLTIPAGLSVRGQSPLPAERLQIPVEQADPAAWYRYIQELIFAGQIEAADAHLRRFRELHPDFVYQP
jgi:hypothetical protein